MNYAESEHPSNFCDVLGYNCTNSCIPRSGKRGFTLPQTLLAKGDSRFNKWREAGKWERFFQKQNGWDAHPLLALVGVDPAWLITVGRRYWCLLQQRKKIWCLPSLVAVYQAWHWATQGIRMWNRNRLSETKSQNLFTTWRSLLKLNEKGFIHSFIHLFSPSIYIHVLVTKSALRTPVPLLGTLCYEDRYRN